MSNKSFLAFIAVLLVGIFGYIIVKQNSKPAEIIIGTQHANQGQDHITQGQKHKAYNSQPASSGPHYADSTAPAPWGVYTQQVPEEVFIHNEEHGGVVITYNPTMLAPDQLKKLQGLLAPPYSNKKFLPTKALVTPRPSNTHAIQIASWTWTLNMDSYDEATLIKYYYQHQGKSPEAGAGPSNRPINQATN